ncbi:hypothetical protein [Runella sp.]|uniref:hypothetical protein n=1 Tax=Runella sp. TaxID=1960881 RepID=UPI003D1159C2
MLNKLKVFTISIWAFIYLINLKYKILEESFNKASVPVIIILAILYYGEYFLNIKK